MANPPVANPKVASLRPPSVPIIVHDPYFSIWLPSEKLADADTQHWTGAAHTIRVRAEIDGKVFRIMGKGTTPAMGQESLRVTPTRTISMHQAEGVGIELQWITPTLPNNLTKMSEPVTYLAWKASAIDGKSHKVALEVESSAQICAADGSDLVLTQSAKVGNHHVLSVGTKAQRVLQRKGDSTTIDWGRFYVAIPTDAMDPVRSAPSGESRESQAKESQLLLKSRAFTCDQKGVESHFAFLYDDEYSIQYFGQNLRPYWRKGGRTAETLLKNLTKSLAADHIACSTFDDEFESDLYEAGGAKFSAIGALAFRQGIGGSKLAADPKGQPLFFPKENTSNGCIATSDVIYPMAPQALLFGSALTRALLTPIMAYAASGRWPFPFAPHDLGTYPQANGQVYGGGEKTEENQMPVEESANMLILVAALAEMEGNGSYAETYWKELKTWAEYLRSKGLDPENQLCTDDFLGHLAHNVNLSAKAILGLKSFAKLCRSTGRKSLADEYDQVSREFAKEWVTRSNDGGYSRLTFDREGTWSQKYNLVWDRILGFDLFPNIVREREMAHYRRKLNPFGLPLDSRGTGAKVDWTLWTASLTQNREDFDALVDGVFRYVNESPQRVAIGDWYNTATGAFNFMHSRPVLGGAYLQLLYNKQTWGKWSSRSKDKAGTYAEIPARPVLKTIVPAADTAGSVWQYRFTAPTENWTSDVSTRDWLVGQGGFGTRGTPGAKLGTVWNGSDIWLKREFELTETSENLKLWLHHDDDVEVYINGVLAIKRSGWTTDYEAMDISTEARKALRKGKNVLAIHCHQNAGGQYIDAGLVREEGPKRK